MPADVTLDGETVEINGNFLEVRGHDLKLDSPRRRSTRGGVVDTSGERRALVHDFEDGLTLNWDQDYPAGVKIEGRTRTDSLEVANALTVNRDASRLTDPSLTVLGKIVMILDVDEFDDLPESARSVAHQLWRAWYSDGDVPLDPRSGRTVAIDGIAKLLADLVARVRVLEERVAALER
jgi:hypothetical protein